MTPPGEDSESLELLMEAGQLLSSKLEVGELLTTVLGLSSRVVSAESASLLLLDEKTSELYFDVALGLGEEAAKVRLPLGQGIAGAVAKDRKPAIINDVRQDSRWSPKMDQESGFVTRSILAVPMLIKGRLIGVLEAINKKGGEFSQVDLRIFQAFASQASVAIENARLFSSLREERFRLHTVFAQMTDGAILIDDAGRVLIANEAAKKYLAFGTDLFWVAEALKEMKVTPPFERLLASSAAMQDFEAVREEPKKLILAGQATRIQLDAGKGESVPGGGKAKENFGWLCVFRDVTEERVKETLKRTFLSLISHKLRTPLASIIGYSDMLRLDFEGKPGQEMSHKAAQAIYTQGSKLSDLVGKLLSYTTLEDTGAPTAQKSPCSLDEIMQDAVKNMDEWLAERKGSVSYEPSGIAVLGDKLQLREVFKNLIENAVKFDPKPEKQVLVWAQRDKDQAIISVRDTGPGIPPEDQDKIYSQFHQIESSFTGQIEGWGLGLPFVKKVVEQYEGSLRLESKLGEGTTVIVSLPLAPA